MDKQVDKPRSLTGGGIHSHGQYDGKDGSKTTAGVRGVYHFQTGLGDVDIAGNKVKKIDYTLFEGVSVGGLGDRKHNKKLVN